MEKKLFCAFLAALMSGAVFVSCKTGTDKPDSTSDSITGTVPVSDSVPDIPVRDLDGLKWNVYGYQPTTENVFYVEEPDNDVITDAIYNSLMAVEDRYCVDITMTYSGVDPGTQAVLIKQMVDIGETSYSIVELHDAIGTGVAIEGYFYNLYEVPHLSLTAPWWHNVEDMALNNRVFNISSDISLIDITNAWCLFFNKDIMDDRRIAYPYQTVLDGSWTLDKLITLTKDVYEDLNKNGESDKGDLYGFECMLSMYGWLDSFGVQTTAKDKDGKLTLMSDLEKVNSIVDTMCGWLKNSVGAKDSGKENFSDSEGFMNGEYMIFMQGLSSVSGKFRYADDLNYGILPMPKWDEKDEYITSCLTYPFWIPGNLPEDQLEISGMLTEALSYQGYKTVAPAYYEVALKAKYNPDGDDSAKMITIVHDSLRPSFAWCYESWQGMYFALYECYMNNGSFMSYYDSRKDSALARIDTVNKALGLT